MHLCSIIFCFIFKFNRDYIKLFLVKGNRLCGQRSKSLGVSIYIECSQLLIYIINHLYHIFIVPVYIYRAVKCVIPNALIQHQRNTKK